MYHGNLAADLSRRSTQGKPVLVWNIRQSLDDLAGERRGTRLAIRLGKRLSSSPDAILYNSTRSRAQHETFGYAWERAQVIANGFDTALWRPNPVARRTMRRALGLSKRDILVGFVGRFHPMKDLANLLRAIAPLMTNGSHIHLAIIGKGNERDNPAFASLYASLPSQKLHILGAQENVQDLLPGFDLFCLSSNSEAFPNVLGEAMACAVPCVATDVGDAGLVLGGTGRVVAPSDPESLRVALATMVALPLEERTRAGLAARERIVETFSLDATVQAYTSLYDTLLENT